MVLGLDEGGRCAGARSRVVSAGKPARVSTRVKIEGDSLKRIEGTHGVMERGADDGLQPRKTA